MAANARACRKREPRLPDVTRMRLAELRKELADDPVALSAIDDLLARINKRRPETTAWPRSTKKRPSMVSSSCMGKRRELTG